MLNLSSASAEDRFIIEDAKWNDEHNRIEVKSKGISDLSVTLSNAVSGVSFANTNVISSEWWVRKEIQNGPITSPVAEQPLVNQSAYSVFAINDLGMHCGDFDTRISSILPPFNVLHAQVIRRGRSPDILGEQNSINVPYVVNEKQHFEQYVGDLPFFLNFPFGYTADNVNWFEAAAFQ